VNSNFLIVLN